MRKSIEIISILFTTLIICPKSSFCQIDWKSLKKYEKYQLLELTIQNENEYMDPFRDVELLVVLKSPSNQELVHYGFYDGEHTWKIRFSPGISGIWTYRAVFSDNSKEISGAFGCIENIMPGRVGKNEFNPFWLGKGGSQKDLFRSFHVGDKFMATNWDDPLDPTDGNARENFLDWLQGQGYNMLSIGSLFTNRDEINRGKDWQTPRLWPLDLSEYRKLELILDDLRVRNITVFPFAGFFGLRGDWPTEHKEQERYVRYLLARIGHYPNIILNVAGPEPAWRKEKSAYKDEMRLVDIRRLGALIEKSDAHNHIITVHNEKRASKYGDPYIDEPWYGMSTLQGPTSLCREELYSGLTMNHHRYKPAFAQETLWAGNMYHPDYSVDQLRKNALTILFSGCIINFAENSGNSSTGFSGSLELSEANHTWHNTLKEVWDWFGTIPFHQMTSRQDLVKNGYCLASEGQDYYIYLDTTGNVEVFLDYGYPFMTEWINAKNPSDIRKGEVVNKTTVFSSPKDNDDWILHVFSSGPEIVGTGNFPNAVVDRNGNIHLVFNNNGLKYQKYDKKSGKWSEVQNTDCGCDQVERSAPEIVIDSKGQPHVFCGKEYAWFNGKKWIKSFPGGTRDTGLAIDSEDNMYLVYRGGNNGGHIGMSKKSTVQKSWVTLPDPDINNHGYNDHVYSEIVIDIKDNIHLVQRRGPEVEVTYRKSTDGGNSWPVIENVVDQWDEGPHIAVNSIGEVFIASGIGELFKRTLYGDWKSIGRKIQANSRMQPELSIDGLDNVYISCFGGRYNTSYKTVWMGERQLNKVTDSGQIGFVKTASAENFSYIIWEEGEGNADEGLSENSSIIIAKLYPDGRIIGIR